ncbi:MAG: Hsp20/alpha crystallin family protein, partial [Cyanobacteria bacterium J06598_3]
LKWLPITTNNHVVFAGVETTPTTWTPAVTLVEGEEALSLQVQLPGVNPDNIDIQASREVIAISGDRTTPELAEGNTLRRNEFRYGSFRRVVSLPVAIDPTAVKADYQAGILVLTLPKAEEERNKVVKVSITGAAGQDAIAASSETPDKSDVTESGDAWAENA